jgi:hypothetical protein
MAAPDLATCTSPGSGGLAPVDPFTAVRYQFGMLLGVDDFTTEQAYHRGKSRLHNAWLHREGVVWGLDVKLDTDHNEIRVTPGLALDAAGRELHLDAEACVDVTQWYNVHSKDPGFSPKVDGTKITFDAHVVIAFQACLTRQVPALMEPCENSGTDTAYSRVYETVKLSLLPGPADVSAKPYHRLRLLFALDAPILKTGTSTPTDDDKAVLDDRNRILELASADQPGAYLAAFRKYAALDEIDLQPATGPDGSTTLRFPADDDTVVLLANITGITLDGPAGALKLTGGNVDRSVRPSHVATATIEELLCGLHLPAPVQKGPQVVAGSVSITTGNTSVTLQTDNDVNPKTVVAAAFSTTLLDATGWTDLVVNNTAWDPLSKTITLTVKTAPKAGTIVRLIARGTGPMPVMGANNIPLGGTDAGPDGQDFVYMKSI